MTTVGKTIAFAIEKTPANFNVKTTAEAKVDPATEEEQNLSAMNEDGTTAAEDEEQRATYTDGVTGSDGGNVTIVFVEEASAEFLESVKLSNGN